FSLIFPRAHFMQIHAHPPITHPAARGGRGGAAPLIAGEGLDTSFGIHDILKRWDPWRKAFGDLPVRSTWSLAPNRPQYAPPSAQDEKGLLGWFCDSLKLEKPRLVDESALEDKRRNFDPASRQHRQFDQLVAFTQK